MKKIQLTLLRALGGKKSQTAKLRSSHLLELPWRKAERLQPWGPLGSNHRIREPSVMLTSVEEQGHIESFVPLSLTASCDGVWGQPGALQYRIQSLCWKFQVYSPISASVSHGLFVTKVR